MSSGQSTPRSANGMVAAHQDSTLGALTVNGAPLEPGPDHFMKCMAQNTTLSKLSNAHDQAEARVKRAEAEYGNMSKHFRDFPVIKDQKTQALADARTALETTRRAFEKQSIVQRQLAEGMGRFLQSAEVKPNRDASSEAITVQYFFTPCATSRTVSLVSWHPVTRRTEFSTVFPTPHVACRVTDALPLTGP